ncbi:hypothetical protein [Pseudonocardia sp. HH130629-09]|uniref:hypothetical protein n=1 Tax=Pseudonocardia sp. HH130629-09 TaxID=1641402 RepID=UPI0006CB00A2|nr:hypothetical protein [Pseudonocardia sp. HH130629-09]ALE82227.1 hypothetical protein XF36_02970 [Pseudonocardia sp. HH130629-09]
MRAIGPLGGMSWESSAEREALDEPGSSPASGNRAVVPADHIATRTELSSIRGRITSPATTSARSVPARGPVPDDERLGPAADDDEAGSTA